MHLTIAEWIEIGEALRSLSDINVIVKVVQIANHDVYLQRNHDEEGVDEYSVIGVSDKLKGPSNG